MTQINCIFSAVSVIYSLKKHLRNCSTVAVLLLDREWEDDAYRLISF